MGSGAVKASGVALIYSQLRSVSLILLHHVAPTWALNCADLSCGFGEALLFKVVRVHAESNIKRGVASEVLDLLDVQPLLEPPGDAGVAKQVRVDLEICGPALH